MKKLGFGLMRLPLLPGEEKKIDLEHLKDMVDYFIEEGFTYFDTAWFYHKEQSEVAIGKALVDRYPRDAYTLADKMPIALLNPEGKSPEEKENELEDYFQKQLEKTGAGFFDYYLLHSLDAKKFAVAKSYRAYEFLLEKKRQGYIKELGCSFHDSPEVLEDILSTYKDLDFIQLQINYLDWDHEKIQSKACYQVARDFGKKIVVMEPIKGGNLARIPEKDLEALKALRPNLSPATWALSFAASLDGVFMVLSGMSNLDQMKENTRATKDFHPLNPEEMEALHRVREDLKKSKTIACTECEYCLTECPQGIPIPSYFAYFNRDKLGLGGDQGRLFANKKEDSTPPSACIACGACQEICPQHLPIIDLLEKVDQHFSH